MECKKASVDWQLVYSPAFADFAIECQDGDEVLAHRVVLASRSEFFTTFFSSGTTAQRLTLPFTGAQVRKMVTGLYVIDRTFLWKITVDELEIFDYFRPRPANEIVFEGTAEEFFGALEHTGASCIEELVYSDQVRFRVQGSEGPYSPPTTSVLKDQISKGHFPRLAKQFMSTNRDKPYYDLICKYGGGALGMSEWHEAYRDDATDCLKVVCSIKVTPADVMRGNSTAISVRLRDPVVDVSSDQKVFIWGSRLGVYSIDCLSSTRQIDLEVVKTKYPYCVYVMSQCKYLMIVSESQYFFIATRPK